MLSGNSLFSLGLFKKNVSRFWPLWSLYTLLLFLLMPFYFLTQRAHWYESPIRTVFQSHLMELAVIPFFTALYAIFVAMALWSYLYNARAVGAIHALPLRRETVFFTNYLTGLLFFLVPSLFIGLLSLLCQAVMGGVALWALGVWLLCQSLMMLFFFSFATLLAFVTGHTLALPKLYVIFSFLFLLLHYLLNDIFRQFVYGFQSSPAITWLGEHLTPIYWMHGQLRASTNPETLIEDGIQGMEYLVVCALIGLVMAGLALLLYRRRKLEMAGEVIAVPALRPVFKYGVGVCGSLFLGYLCYSMFAVSGRMFEGFWSMLFWLLLWGAVFYYTAAMLIRKSFRVFKTEWRGCAILLLALLLSMVAVEWDVFGVEQRVPEASQVISVRTEGSTYKGYVESLEKDGAFIEAVIAFHEIAANSKDEVSYWEENVRDYGSMGEGVEEQSWDFVLLRYSLVDGGELVRSYRIPISRTLLNDEGSLAYAYNALVNDPLFRAENAFPSNFTREKLYQAEYISFVETDILKSISRERDVKIETSEYRGDLRYEGYFFTREEALRLYDAVEEDVKAGALGINYLLWSEERANLLAGQLTFYFRQANGDNATVTIELSATPGKTLALMEEFGFARGAALFTWDEYEILSNSYHDAGSVEAQKYAESQAALRPQAAAVEYAE